VAIYRNTSTNLLNCQSAVAFLPICHCHFAVLPFCLCHSANLPFPFCDFAFLPLPILPGCHVTLPFCHSASVILPLPFCHFQCQFATVLFCHGAREAAVPDGPNITASTMTADGRIIVCCNLRRHFYSARLGPTLQELSTSEPARSEPALGRRPTQKVLRPRWQMAILYLFAICTLSGKME
jgi:hypothetical protein